MHRKNSFFARTILLIMGISTLSSCFNPPEPLGLDILKNDFELTRDYIYMGDFLDTSLFVHNSQDYEGHWYLYASAHFDQGIVFGWFTIPPHYLMVNIETGDGVYINDQIQYDYHCDFNFDTGSATPFWITHSTQTITSEDGEIISGFLLKVALEVHHFIKETETSRLNSLDHVKNTLNAQGYTLVKQDNEAKSNEIKAIYDELFYPFVLKEYYSGYQTNQPIDLKIYVLKNQQEATKLYYGLRNARYHGWYFYRTGRTVVTMSQETIYHIIRNS